jgi:hypothetical protein
MSLLVMGSFSEVQAWTHSSANDAGTLIRREGQLSVMPAANNGSLGETIAACEDAYSIACVRATVMPHAHHIAHHAFLALAPPALNLVYLTARIRWLAPDLGSDHSMIQTQAQELPNSSSLQDINSTQGSNESSTSSVWDSVLITYVIFAFEFVKAKVSSFLFQAPLSGNQGATKWTWISVAVGMLWAYFYFTEVTLNRQSHRHPQEVIQKTTLAITYGAMIGNAKDAADEMEEEQKAAAEAILESEAQEKQVADSGPQERWLLTADPSIDMKNPMCSEVHVEVQADDNPSDEYVEIHVRKVMWDVDEDYSLMKNGAHNGEFCTHIYWPCGEDLLGLHYCLHGFFCMPSRVADTYYAMSTLPVSHGVYWAMVIGWQIFRMRHLVLQQYFTTSSLGEMERFYVSTAIDAASLVYLTRFRYHLRQRLGSPIPHSTTVMLDYLHYFVCGPCTVVQDARQIDAATDTEVRCCFEIAHVQQHGTVGEPVGVDPGEKDSNTEETAVQSALARPSAQSVTLNATITEEDADGATASLDQIAANLRDSQASVGGGGSGGTKDANEEDEEDANEEEEEEEEEEQETPPMDAQLTAI